MGKKNPVLLKIFNKTVKYLIRGASFLNLYMPMAYLYAKLFLIKVDGGRPDPSKPSILGIKPEYFMGDLEILAKSGQFNVYKIKNKFQSMLLRVYWDDRFWEKGENAYYVPEDPEIIKYQERLRTFLGKFLRILYRIKNIKCVIVANVSYKDCYDWGIATKSIGVPYIVLQRENLFACPGLVRLWRDIKTKTMGKFHGSEVVLHNETVKKIYLESNYASEEQIAVLGCMRMDKYIKKIRNYDFANEKKHNRVTLFSFHHISLLETMYDEYFNPKIGYVKLFENVHTVFARNAIAHPDKEFIIKPRYGGAFYKRIREVLENNGIDIDKIPNLKMDASLNAHDVILNSDFVCAFASTVILEAAIARRPVIIPYFDEALNPEYQDFILFKEYFNYFDLADSPEKMNALMEKRFGDSKVSDEYTKKMGELFEQYISSFDGDSTEKYINYLNDVITNNRV